MAKKKPEPQASADEQLLEARVDAMMEPDTSKQTAESSAEVAHVDVPGADLPPLDIFEGATTAPDVPGDLLQEAGVKELSPDEEAAEPVAAVQESEETEEAPKDLIAPDYDDPATDAAVDDIVAHESGEPLEEDAGSRGATAQDGHKAHHHPFFWSLVTIIAVLALVIAWLLASGGNLSFPGGDRIQNWLDALRNR